MTQPFHILAIDPGLRRCGFAVLEFHGIGNPCRLLDLGVNETDEELTIIQRVNEFNRDFDGLMSHWQPKVVVVEAPSLVRSATASQMLGMSYGVITGRCRAAGSDLGALLVNLPARTWRGLLHLPHGGDDKARKLATRAWAFSTYPYAKAMLEAADNAKPSDWQHALDAVAIGTAWTIKATVAHEAAQPEGEAR